MWGCIPMSLSSPPLLCHARAVPPLLCHARAASPLLAIIPRPPPSLASRLLVTEDNLHQLRARHREDARANAHATEIFTGHRTAWTEAEGYFSVRSTVAGYEAMALHA
jgi:hypothetical protein